MIATTEPRTSHFIPIEGGSLYAMESAHTIGVGVSTASLSACVWMSRESAEALCRDLAARVGLFVAEQRRDTTAPVEIDCAESPL